MKTTLEIDDSLHGRAKAEAAKKRIPLTRLIEEALRRHLEGPPGTPGTRDSKAKGDEARWRPQVP